MVTLNIIIDELALLNKEILMDDLSGYEFSGCLQIPQGTVNWKKDILYVGSLSQLGNIDPGTRNEAVCICLRDTEEACSGSRSRLIIIDEPFTCEELINRIQTLFFSLSSWELQLYTAVSKGKSAQELLDLSVPFIPNHIQITDSTFMKIASTDSITCDDPICVRLSKYGYHPADTIETFRKNNLYSVWDKALDIYYDPATNVSKYPTLHRIFKKRGIYYAHSVMTCNNVPVTPGLQDKYRILTDAVESVISQLWAGKSSIVHVYDAFFTNLLEGKIVNNSEIQERASYLGFPTEGRFRIMCIEPRNNESVISDLMMAEFSANFPRFKLLYYKNNIVAAVHSVSLNDDIYPESNDKVFSEFLEKYNADCGISLPIYDLSDISYGFRQVQLALKYRLLPIDEACNDKKQAGGNIHRFEDLFTYIFTGEGHDAKDLWYHTYHHHKLYKLWQYDKLHGTDFFKLLRVYVENERRITDTAAVMNLHRNSLPYRIAKLQQILEMDLGNISVRKQISHCLILLALYGFDKGQDTI